MEINYNGTIFDGAYLYNNKGIWRRNVPKEFYELCLTELAGNILYLTKELPFNNNNFYTEGQSIQDCVYTNTMICICGQSNCSKLYLVYYKPTNLCFAVGSHCIFQFKPLGYETIEKDICLVCCCKLSYKTSKNFIKNGVKNYPYCNNCHKSLFLKKFFKKMN
jgi:hypothetical protein